MGSIDRRRPKGARRTVVLALGALGFLACGGTTVGHTSTNGTPDGPDGSSNAGGSTSGTGGSTSGTGGRGSGGAPICFGMGCPPIHCAPGFKAVTLPGACCPSCVNDCGTVDCSFPSCPPGVMTYVPVDQCCAVCGPDCRLVDCAPPACPPGSKFIPLPDQCCSGTCTPVTVDASAPVCNPGMDVFLKEQIASLKALSCGTSTDCAIVMLGFQCRLDCGTAVNNSSAGPLISMAQTFSMKNCSGCPVTDVACPPVIYTAECQNGQCVRVP